MSFLFFASKRTKHITQPYFYQKSILCSETEKYRHWLSWLLGMPICIMLGAASNYSWHHTHIKPVIHRTEVLKPTILPYKYQQAEVEFNTNAFPEPVNGGKNTKIIEQQVDAPSNEQQTFSEPKKHISLQNKLLQAINETNRSNITTQPKDAGNISINSLPENILKKISNIDYEAHIYSSIAKNSSIKINHHNYHEGDEIMPGVILFKISPQESIFITEGNKFSLSALSNWIKLDQTLKSD